MSRLRLAALVLLVACSDSPSGLPSPGDPEALLTDMQLTTPQDTVEVSTDPAWDQWVRTNHYTIRSLTSTRTDDLKFLKTVIGNRRLVQLGESGHGVREFNMAKVRLIRFLHEEMGFDVIAFESGLFECWKANELAATSTAELTMRRCPFGVWHTDEVIKLFEYIRETKSTARPLILAGVDVQMSSTQMQFKYAPPILTEVVGKIDPAYAARLAILEDGFYGEYSAARSSAPLDPARLPEIMIALDERMGYSAKYDSLRVFLDANASALAAAYAANPGIPLVARQLAFSRVQNILQGKSPTFNGGSTTRDRGMADNVDFLLDRLYPGKKIMVWAHNAHIMHSRSTMTMIGTPTTFPQSMGAFISTRRRADVYTIGLFMYRGFAANNAGQSYSIRPPLPGSLEATLYRARKQWTFVDMLSQSRTAANSWMFDPIPGKEWGTNEMRFAPRAQFDGILFIDTVNPPAYFSPTTNGGI